jgi:hypothetical protein
MKEALRTNYFFSLFKKLQELQQFIQTQNLFRILSIEKNASDEYFFKIQLIGKSTVFDAAPRELAESDILLEGFSKKDVRIITYYATKEIAQPQYKVLVQEFEDKTHKTLFKLGRRGESSPLEKTAAQISLDKELLKQISQEDAHMVGYTTAMESMQKEKEAIKKLNCQLINPCLDSKNIS